jgi:hypothetical protein
MTGVDESVVVPFPNSPLAFPHQHLPVPFANNAHEGKEPAEIAVAVVKPLTTTGVDEFAVVPFPNSPEKLSPPRGGRVADGLVAGRGELVEYACECDRDDQAGDETGERDQGEQ